MSRLVVRAPNWVGDLSMATAVLAAAARDPRWEEVHVLLRAHLAPLLADLPFPVTVHPAATPSQELDVLRGVDADAALLLTTSFRSAWLAWRAGVPVRAGASTGGRRALLTHAVRPATLGGRRAPTPTAHLQRDVAGLLGIEVPDLHPRLGIGPGVREAVRARLGFEGAYVLASPGAAFGAAKLWPPERFAGALDAIAGARGWRAVVVGTPQEQPLAQAVVAAASRPVLSIQVDLSELRALVAEAGLLLVGDSGPRWIAAAFDVPCVSVMGPIFPQQTATSLERARVVRVEGLECAPCLERRCPLGHHRCMTELPVEPVVAAAEELLA
jgi:heptosyltransferase-2